MIKYQTGNASSMVESNPFTPAKEEIQVWKWDESKSLVSMIWDKNKTENDDETKPTVKFPWS